ncbi:MAG: hypothetical protein EXS24_00395 [Pedosphaera sp.]|nr:hypothetical protein [Pedosphaera sp.]
MKTLLLAAALIALCLFGCGDKSAAKSEPEPKPEPKLGENPLNAPVDYLGAVNQGKKAAIGKLNLAQMTQAIQQFAAAEGRNPKDLQEVISKGYLAALPPLPLNQKLVYNPDTGAVQVVNQ